MRAVEGEGMGARIEYRNVLVAEESGHFDRRDYSIFVDTQTDEPGLYKRRTLVDEVLQRLVAASLLRTY